MGEILHTFHCLLGQLMDLYACKRNQMEPQLILRRTCHRLLWRGMRPLQNDPDNESQGRDRPVTLLHLSMSVRGAEVINSPGGVTSKAQSPSGDNTQHGSFQEVGHPKLCSVGRQVLAILSSDQIYHSANVLHHFQNMLLLLRAHYQGLNLQEYPLLQG